MIARKDYKVQQKLTYGYYRRERIARVDRLWQRRLAPRLRNNSRLLSVCKIIGTKKRTNKNMGVGRHFIRLRDNRRYLSPWRVQVW